MRIPPFLTWTTGWSSRFSSIGSRTLLRSIIVLAVLWAAASLIGLSAIHAAATRQIDMASANVAAVVAQELERSITAIDASLRRVANGLQGAEQQDLTPAQQHEILFAGASMLPGVGFFDELNDKGDTTDGLQPPQHHENWEHTDYFNQHRSNAGADLFIGQPFSVKTPQFAGFTISRRMSHPDGSFAGVVVFGLKFSYLREIFERLSLGTESTIALVRSDGVVLARQPSDANTIGRSLDSADLFTQAVQARTGQMAFDDPIDHVRRQFALRPIGALPLVVAVGLSPQDTGAGWWAETSAMIGAGTLLALLAIAAALRAEQESHRRVTMEQQIKDKVSQFATVSHVLRDSLHDILGCAEQLQNAADLPSPYVPRLNAIVRSGQQFGAVVDQLLDYWRFGTHGPEIRMRRVDLPELLGDCRAILEPEARVKSLEFRYTPSPDAPRHFVTDGALLRLILMNLLKNAIKFTRHGKIELRYAGTVNRIRFEVADTGPGIRPDQRHRLFHEFERLGADAMGIAGTGVGFSIADRLTRLMGGQIGHQDNPAGGSIFWVELPAGVAQEPAEPIDEAASSPERPLRILVVDDSAVHRDLATAILTRAGHDVVATANGSDGVRLADAEDFDVILMDMRMPGMNGLDAVRKIRALQGRRRAVPIIAVTADALDTDREEYRRVGLVDQLPKPFAAADLLATLAEVVRRRAPAAAAPIRPLPAASGSPLLDVATLARFEDAIGSELTVHHLTELLDTIALLRDWLRAADRSADPERLAKLAHAIVGDAGQLGFVAISEAACQLISSVKHNPKAVPTASATLRAVAEQSLIVLDQRIESLRRDQVEAAKPSS
jgi:signal transduction histidine kinase/DNA-binding response OmpR family regulator